MPELTTAETPPGADDADRLVRWEGPPIPNRKPTGGPWPVRFYRSQVGKKWVMALTGIIMIGYVVAHAAGNLKIYTGEEAFNNYAEFLRHFLYPILPESGFLWAMRPLLLLALIFHVHAAASLTIQNRKSRTATYQSHRNYIAANFASRSMRWTGIIVFLFIVFHIMDLTIGSANPDFEHGEAYNNLVVSLERWPVAAIYIVANLALGIHLFHGAWSMFQSLGWNSPRFNPARRWIAIAIAAFVIVVNLSFPIAILAGWVTPEGLRF